MGARISIKFDVSDVAAKLSLVQSTMGRIDALTRGMEDALRPVAAAAGRIAPQPGSSGYTTRYGKRAKRPHLKDQMIVASRLYPRKKVIVGVAGPRYAKRNGANFAHNVEDGHRIAGGHGKGRQLRVMQKAGWTNELVWSKRLRTMVYKHGAPRRNRMGATIVQSAGNVAPRPFLEPAADQNKATAQNVFTNAVGRFVDEALAPMKTNG